MDTSRDALGKVAEYYEAQLAGHGVSPQGTGWNGPDAQRTRFAQLDKLLPDQTRFSLIDLGCGYGAFVDFLNERNRDFHYLGCDISARMIDCAKDRYRDRPDLVFEVSSRPTVGADYCVASGIFNVPMGAARADWEGHVEATIELMHRAGRRGFAFNCLTSYSDREKMLPSLYYGDPCHLFDLCKREYSGNVALLHDYGLYDFTIIVRKE